MRLLTIALVASMVAGTANAQPSTPPTYSVGDTWTFSMGNVLKVEKVDEHGMALSGINRQCPICLYHYDKSLTLMRVTNADGTPVDSTSPCFPYRAGECGVSV